jgi:hypothetical protein
MMAKKKLKLEPIPDIDVTVTITVSAEKVWGVARMLPIYDAMNGCTNAEAEKQDYQRAVMNRVLEQLRTNAPFIEWVAAHLARANAVKKEKHGV